MAGVSRIFQCSFNSFCIVYSLLLKDMDWAYMSLIQIFSNSILTSSEIVSPISKWAEQRLSESNISFFVTWFLNTRGHHYASSHYKELFNFKGRPCQRRSVELPPLMTDFSVVCQPSGPLSDTVFRILRVSHTSGMSSTFLPLLYEKSLKNTRWKISAFISKLFN